MAEETKKNDERYVGGFYGGYGGNGGGGCGGGCDNGCGIPCGGDCGNSCGCGCNGYGFGFDCGLDGNFGYNPYMGFGYGLGWASSYYPGYVCGICMDEYLIQYACQLRGECVRIVLEHSPSICGRLVQINLSYLSVSVEGTVAYIPFCEVVAIIPI